MPLVETYIQYLRADNQAGSLPRGDKYFLARAELAQGTELEPLDRTTSMNQKLFGGLREFFSMEFVPRGFLQTTSKEQVVWTFRRKFGCRVLMTSTLESLTMGHTIVLSRGLIDVLPDEASLAAILAYEIGHIALGHRMDSKFGFFDNVRVNEKGTFPPL
jgi:hypothetical protein